MIRVIYEHTSNEPTTIKISIHDVEVYKEDELDKVIGHIKSVFATYIEDHKNDS